MGTAATGPLVLRAVALSDVDGCCGNCDTDGDFPQRGSSFRVLEVTVAVRTMDLRTSVWRRSPITAAPIRNDEEEATIVGVYVFGRN